MSGALAVVDDMPDLLGTAPSDLLPNTDEFADTVTARRRAERIRAHLVTFTQMRQDIADAFAYRDWAALGYSSWYAYLEGEFGPELQQLARNRDERRQAARDLRAGGLSTRQIAGAMGVDAKTVRNDLAGAPAPAAVTGADGKTYPAAKTKPERPCGAQHPHPAHEGDYRCPGVPETPAGEVTPSLPAVPPAAGPAGDESPAGPAAGADPAPAAARSRAGRALPTDSPAGRDLRAPAFDSGEAGSAAVATPGQPGPQLALVAAERRKQITANVGTLALAIGNLRELLRDVEAGDLPLFALRQQRDDLDRLIRRLEHTTAQEGS